MSYSKTIDYIYNLQKHGIKFGLNNIIRLVSILGNPHKAFYSVHVAGTNGKGSTSAIIASILKAAGFNVGLFTSPHIVSFTERIRVNGKEISEDDIIILTEEIREKIISINSFDTDFSPTFFEVVTAMAFLYFQRKGIDIAVIEVGMGGRLDATNILTPEISVITNVDFDHLEFLGRTLKEIAYEKAGIIKEGIPVVVSSQDPEVLKVIEAKAKERNSEVYLYDRDFSAVLRRNDPSGVCFDYFDDSFIIHDLYLSLAGEHQMRNASVAIKAVELLSKKITPNFEPLTPNFIREGLRDVKWPGRLEMIHGEPPILIDGAHNPSAAKVLSDAINKHYLGIYKRIILILGVMDDKDIEGIMRHLLPIAYEIILTSPNYDRAAKPAKLAAIAASLGFRNVKIVFSLKDAIEMAVKIAKCGMLNSKCEMWSTEDETIPKSEICNPKSLILITGSFYTIGEAKEALGYKGVLTRLRE
ncbi:MAG: bifunctional folylpolyglutamate synthase/dihydrofolate synthase [Nitrospirae bacterium]|nr:bifunctional folylpolyglutamate synthase/dihydrofolate synthase [Nitrospirota bacterium]